MRLEGAAFAALFVFFAAGLAGATATLAEVDGRREKIVIETTSGEIAINAEIADTPARQSQGLMFRRSLDPRHGMLFLYPTAQEVRMWMKNTYIPLDMVFIRSNGTIHRIERNTEPFSEATISSEGEVTGVLEISGGGAASLGIKTGDRVRHKHFTMQD